MKLFSEEAIAALKSGDNIVAGAVRLALPEPVRVWGGHGFQVLDGEVYQPLGDRGLVKISAGAVGGAAQGATLELSGVDPDVWSQIDLDELRAVPVVIWRLVFNGAGRTLLQASVFLRGSVDHAPLDETQGGTSVFRLTVEGSARGLGRRSERMRTDADQRLINPTDGSFRRVSYAGEKLITWGGKPPERAGLAFGGAR